MDPAHVEATLPFLNRQVRGLVEFIRFTGCRPGEACRLRRCDLDTSGTIWLYRPSGHKSEWRVKVRVISVGLRAQAMLAGYPTADAAEYVYSPARATAEHHAARTAARTTGGTPRYPSHMKRNGDKRATTPKRPRLGVHQPRIRSRRDAGMRAGRGSAVGTEPTPAPVPSGGPKGARTGSRAAGLASLAGMIARPFAA